MSARVLLISVILLGVTLLSCVAGIIVLALNSLPIPDVLQNIAVGALTGLSLGSGFKTRPEAP